MPGTDASPFSIPENLDAISGNDQTANAYQQAVAHAVLIREAIDATGTTAPDNISAGAETTTYDASKIALLAALDTVIAEARTITDLLPTA